MPVEPPNFICGGEMYPTRRIQRFGSTFIAILVAVVSGCTDSSNVTTASSGPGTTVKPVDAMAAGLSAPSANECSKSGAGWIFCDDFEANRLSKYFEYDDAGGK